MVPGFSPSQSTALLTYLLSHQKSDWANISVKALFFLTVQVLNIILTVFGLKCAFLASMGSFFPPCNLVSVNRAARQESGVNFC